MRRGLADQCPDGARAQDLRLHKLVICGRQLSQSLAPLLLLRTLDHCTPNRHIRSPEEEGTQALRFGKLYTTRRYLRLYTNFQVFKERFFRSAEITTTLGFRDIVLYIFGATYFDDFKVEEPSPNSRSWFASRSYTRRPTSSTSGFEVANTSMSSVCSRLRTQSTTFPW